MKLNKLRKLRKSVFIIDGLYTNNPVLIQGLALPFAILVTTSLKNGVALSILMTCSLIPTMLAASFISHYLPRWIRIVVSCGISSVCVIATSLLVGKITPEIFDSLGMYFPIMAVNSLMIMRTEYFAVKERPHIVLMDAITNSIGFSAVVCLMSCIRELFGNGTIWGNEIGIPMKFSGLLVGFSGFILVALLAAFIKATKRLFLYIYCREMQKKHPEITQKTQETV